MAIREDEIYKRAYQQLEVLSMDEATRWQYEAREAWLKDEATRRSEALEEGQIINQLNNAVSLLDILDDATIAQKIALPIEIVQRLRAGEDAEKIKKESRKNY